ncbi:MAG: hypothetical protein MI748_18550 [Opitutales bacterium]|nr:hypothetical protein [Opitutales bacterium]
MNFRRDHLHNPINIFTLALTGKEVNLDGVMEPVLAEINSLNKGINIRSIVTSDIPIGARVWHGGLGIHVSIQVHLGLFIADMPQHNESAWMKGVRADHGCHICYAHYQNEYHLDA